MSKFSTNPTQNTFTPCIHYDHGTQANLSVVLAVPPPQLPVPGQEEWGIQQPLILGEQKFRQKTLGYHLLRQLVTLLMSGLSFSLAVSATVLSGGGGIPLAAMTGLSFVIAVGDLCCTLYNLIEARNGKLRPSTEGDCIALAVNHLAQKCGRQPKQAEGIGAGVSILLKASILATYTLLPVFLPHPPINSSDAAILSKASSSISAGLVLCRGLANYFYDQNKREKSHSPHKPIEKPDQQTEKHQSTEAKPEKTTSEKTESGVIKSAKADTRTLKREEIAISAQEEMKTAHKGKKNATINREKTRYHQEELNYFAATLHKELSHMLSHDDTMIGAWRV